MGLQSTLVVVAVLLGGNNLFAQSQPGLAYDLYTRTGGVSGDTTTNVAHMKGTANALRMEFDQRPTGGAYRSLPVGDHGVVIIRSSGAELVILDPDKKQYMSIKPLEMASGARQMMESVGGSITFDTAASSVRADSLGPGPTIDGHNTLRYRLSVHTKLRIAMMGQDQTVESQAVSETDNAVDLPEFRSVVGPAAGLRDMMQSMAQTVGVPKDFMDQAMKAGQRVRGFPLHSEKQTTSITPRGTLTISETSDAKNVRRVSIPDSTFAVPADYKLMPFPLGRPQPSPDQN